MCGLTAIIDRSVVESERKIFRDLLVLSSLRGLDSTGVASVELIDKSFRKRTEGTENEDIPIVGSRSRSVKTLGDPFSLFRRPEYARVVTPITGYTTKALIGHCRAATKGTVSAQNAHPFVTDHLTGVHNGTIRSGLEIPDGETDSQALFEHIDKNGIDGLKKVNGAFALIWYDSRDNKVYAIRNEERPLFYTKSGTSFMLSSEKEFLDLVLSRTQGLNTNAEVSPLKPFHLLTFDLPEIDRMWAASDTTLPDCISMEDVRSKAMFQYPSFSTGSSFSHQTWRGRVLYEDTYYTSAEGWDEELARISKANEERTKTTEKGATETYPGGDRGDPPLIKSLSPDVEGVVGNLFHQDLFPCIPIGAGVIVPRFRHAEYLSKGCQWCGEVRSETDPVIWGESTSPVATDFHYNEYLCEACASNDYWTASQWAGFDTRKALEVSRVNASILSNKVN